MATVTTNFNFPIPQSTDLVKDGATAIAALGTAIDTDFVDLKGGTTGQVLSKASGTDLDFTWVAQDDSNAIQNAIVDAKGDLIAASAADTPARLAVGNNGETLLADSSTSSGLRWQVPFNVNPVLNSNFSVWQRGTSIAAAGSVVYAADRFAFYRADLSTGATVSRQVTGDTTNLPNIQYCARVQRDSGNTGTINPVIAQPFETANSIPYAGKSVIVSFYARAGANFSAAGSILAARIASGTGTDQSPNSFRAGSWTGQTTLATLSQAITTTWTRYSFTATIGATATQLNLNFQYTPVGTAGANDYFEITGIQLEVGSVATPFNTYAGTIQEELAACQRYYIRTTSTGTDSNHGIGLANSTTTAYIHANIAEMRVIPTSVDYANLNVSDSVNNFTFSGLSINSANSTPRLAFLIATGASGMTQFRPLFMRNNNNTAGYLGLSAEL